MPQGHVQDAIHEPVGTNTVYIENTPHLCPTKDYKMNKDCQGVFAVVN